ncbi:hypothetical protein AAC387_Pa03g4050 [Persea americana]
MTTITIDFKHRHQRFLRSAGGDVTTMADTALPSLVSVTYPQSTLKSRNAPKQDGEPLASDKYSKPRLSFLFHFQDKKREEREKRKNRLSSSLLNRLKEK